MGLNKEKRERLVKWLKAPRVKNYIMDAPKKIREKKMNRYICANLDCGKRVGLRFVDDGPGVICEACYVHGERCSKQNCSEVAVFNGLCRDHFMDEPDDLIESYMDRTSPQSILGDTLYHTDDYKGFYTREGRKRAREMMEHYGVPSLSHRYRNEVIYIGTADDWRKKEGRG